MEFILFSLSSLWIFIESKRGDVNADVVSQTRIESVSFMIFEIDCLLEQLYDKIIWS